MDDADEALPEIPKPMCPKCHRPVDTFDSNAQRNSVTQKWEHKDCRTRVRSSGLSPRTKRPERASPYTDEHCESLRQQLLKDPFATTCPIHGTPIRITRTIAWRRNGDLTEDHEQEGWPSGEWTVRRAWVLCSACDCEEAIRLDSPTRAPKQG